MADVELIVVAATQAGSCWYKTLGSQDTTNTPDVGAGYRGVFEVANDVRHTILMYVL